MGNELVLKEANNFIQTAIDKNIEIEKLKQLIDLRNQEIARQAKADFDFNFAEMQKDFRPAIKDKSVKNKEKTKTLYSYCPLENILEVYQPILSAHGFSYRWSIEPLENKSIRVWCAISGYGHEEKTFVDVPVMAGNDFTNSVQQMGSSITYGKRYSFINAVGVIVSGEDDDAVGATVPRDEKTAEELPVKSGRLTINSMSDFIALINSDTVPMSDRPAWMQSARGGKDVSVLREIADRIMRGEKPNSETQKPEVSAPLKNEDRKPVIDKNSPDYIPKQGAIDENSLF